MEMSINLLFLPFPSILYITLLLTQYLQTKKLWMFVWEEQVDKQAALSKQSSHTYSQHSIHLRKQKFVLKTVQEITLHNNILKKVDDIKKQIKLCRDFLGWIDKAKEIRTVIPLKN